MTELNLNELFVKIPIFKQRWLDGQTFVWGKQYMGPKDVEYVTQKRPLRTEDIFDHFYQKDVGKNASKGHGSIAISGKFDTGRAKWWCIDGDNQEAVDTINNKVLPVMRTVGMPYLYELSGRKNDRCHVWSFCEANLEKLRKVVFEIFRMSSVDPRSLEIYPIIKENFFIRVPLGRHMRTGKVHPVLIDDEEVTDPLTFFNYLQSFPVYDDAWLDEFIRKYIPTEPAKAERKKVKSYHKGTFLFSDQFLPVPQEDYDKMPHTLRRTARNCRAINWLITESINEGLLGKRIGMAHDAGLILSGLAMFDDLCPSIKSKVSGKEWLEYFFGKYRNRDWSSHYWDANIAQHRGSRDRLFPSCKTLEKTFGKCDGCPFAYYSTFKSPKPLVFGQTVRREPIQQPEYHLVSADEVRNSTFKRFHDRVFQLVAEGTSKRLLLASPQGAGKSYAASNLAVELAREGKNVLISVPTGDLALEYKKRIEAAGQHAFVVMSHRNIFMKLEKRFGCPQFEEIQELIRDYSMDSGTIRKTFCEKCSFEDQCKYPKQYAEAAELQHKIVIIQHAHFSSKQAMMTLLKNKTFDVLMIDEEFIDRLLQNITATELEISVLESFQTAFPDAAPWISALIQWFREGGYPPKSIHPRLSVFRKLREFFMQSGTPWRLPEFIRLFNDGQYMDPGVGIHVFTPPPIHSIPLTLLLNATPPLEQLEIVLDDPHIEVHGGDEILDYRKLNPENRVIQLLDSSMSKTSLRGQKLPDGSYDFIRFIEIIEFIGDLARKQYADKKILITTYKTWKPMAQEWLQNNYPEIMDRVLINHMAVGTNAFEDFEIQFLVAGVYLNGKDFHKAVYELKVIANYWNRKQDRPPIPNFFQFGISENTSIERRPIPVSRIHAYGHSGQARRFEYPDMQYYRPVDYYQNIIERAAIAKTQQSIRLRFNDTRKRIVYIFGKFFLPTFLVTDSALEEELLGYLRQEDDTDS